MIINSENYFSKQANWDFMSNSQFKWFLECEAKAMANINEEWVYETSDAMLQGKYVHAWNENKLKQFIENSPNMFKKDGYLFTKFEICNTVIETIEKDNLFMNALAGQKEVVFTAEMFGTPWKILIDSYFPDKKRFGDLKVLKSIDDKFWNKEERRYMNVFEKYGYLTQVAVYAEIERLANKREDHYEPFLVVVTKEKYPDKAIISFNSNQETYTEFIQKQLSIVEYHMPGILAVKSGKEKPQRCEKCDYCRSNKKLTGTIHYSHFDNNY